MGSGRVFTLLQISRHKQEANSAATTFFSHVKTRSSMKYENLPHPRPQCLPCRYALCFPVDSAVKRFGVSIGLRAAAGEECWGVGAGGVLRGGDTFQVNSCQGPEVSFMALSE